MVAVLTVSRACMCIQLFDHYLVRLKPMWHCLSSLLKERERERKGQEMVVLRGNEAS